MMNKNINLWCWDRDRFSLNDRFFEKASSGRTQSGRSRCWKLAIASSVFVGGAIVYSGNCVLAQPNPIPDEAPERNLGTQVEALTPLVDQIQGGTQHGNNLFHSFSEFNVGEGRSVYFENSDGVTNILSRVTEKNPSEILGTLGVGAPGALGTANLFLINPNGIIFGPNARLDVGGSFVATTADSVVFDNGFAFSATNPQAPPLLTINVPLGLQFGANPGSIVNQSVEGLEVQPGRTLALVGSEVAIKGGVLTAPDGRIELGSVAGNNLVSLTPTATGYALDYRGVKEFQDISLSQAASVSTIGDSGGSIQVQGRNVMLIDGSGIAVVTLGAETGGGLTVNASESVQLIGTSADGRVASGLLAGTLGTGEAGDLTINTPVLLVSNGAQVSASTLDEGNGGSLIVNASESVQLIGTSADSSFPSGLLARTQGTGEAGDLTINTPVLLVSDGAQVDASTLDEGGGGSLIVNASESVQLIGRSANGRFPSGLLASTEGTGEAGSLTINTPVLLVSDGALVSTSTLDEGDGGSLIVNASESVQLIGRSANGQASSGLFTQTEGTGEAGDLTINTPVLLVSDGAQTSTSTLDEGDGGSLIVNASESVQLIGTSVDGRFASGLLARTQGTGEAGDLTINTPVLLLSNGAQVDASTLDEGDGGSLIVNASESVQLIGRSANGRTHSGLLARTQGTGEAGDLTINTPVLLVSNGAQVSASTFDEGDGGSLIVNASESVQLIGTSVDGRFPSALFAQTQGTGEAGDLTINTPVLLVSDGAGVSTSTLDEGDGGSLIVNASESVQLIGISVDGRFASGLLASTQGTGEAGDLTINTPVLLVSNGAQTSTSTFDEGNGGSLIVNASESVQLIGTSANGRIASGLFALTQGTGEAGSLTITTPQLLISDRAQATVSSFGEGVAGNLGITADSVQLDNGKILAQTLSGDGGNLDLRVTDLLLLRNDSEISTTAGTDQKGGDGGNITIDTDFIVAVPSEDSDITANAFSGRGGNIDITATGIYGTEFREQQTPESDITASSDFGVDGVVELNTPDVDPSRGLVNLPAELVDVTGLIAQDCLGGGGTVAQSASNFVVTGRGGLPPNPTEPLRSDAVRVDLDTPIPSQENHASAAVTVNPTTSESSPLVEAQGWMINDKGEVVLLAQASTVTPSSSPSTPATCHAS